MEKSRKVQGKNSKNLEIPRKTYYLAIREIVYLATRYPGCRWCVAPGAPGCRHHANLSQLKARECLPRGQPTRCFSIIVPDNPTDV